MNTPTSALQRISGILRRFGFDTMVANSKCVALGSVSNELGTFDFVCWVNPAPSLLHARLLLPRLVVEETIRAEVAELLVRANAAWPFGHLCLDMTTGSVNWHGSIPVDDGELTQQQVQHLLDAGTAMVHYYRPAIERLIHDRDLSPAAAIAEVEMAELDEA